jgi:UDP-glucose 4-epimerase
MSSGNAIKERRYMKILVTGGAGFIASHVVDRYIQLGHQVVVVDNLSTGNIKNVNPLATFYLLDITSPEIEKIFEIEKPDIVNHHAAQISVPLSVKNPFLDLDTNAKGFLNILQCAVKHHIKKIIFISSGGAIYGEATQYPTTESYFPIPLSPYAIHKYLSELYLQYYRSAFHLSYTTLRYANVFGPRQIPTGEAGVVSIFIDTLLSGQAPSLFAYSDAPDGMIRDYVYVHDVVEANVLALERATGEAINIGTCTETTTGELLRAICTIMGKDFAPTRLSPRPGDIRKSCISIEKAKNILAWQPSYSLNDALQETINFFSK